MCRYNSTCVGTLIWFVSHTHRDDARPEYLLLHSLLLGNIRATFIRIDTTRSNGEWQRDQKIPFTNFISLCRHVSCTFFFLSLSLYLRVCLCVSGLVFVRLFIFLFSFSCIFLLSLLLGVKLCVFVFPFYFHPFSMFS